MIFELQSLTVWFVAFYIPKKFIMQTAGVTNIVLILGGTNEYCIDTRRLTNIVYCIDTRRNYKVERQQVH